jgi:hypothetical protein
MKMIPILPKHFSLFADIRFRFFLGDFQERLIFPTDRSRSVRPKEKHNYAHGNGTCLVPRSPFTQTVQLERSYSLAGASLLTPLVGQGLDISPQGLGLTADFPLKKGEVLKVYISIQDTNTPLPVLSEVCWAESGPQPCRAGLKFLI